MFNVVKRWQKYSLDRPVHQTVLCCCSLYANAYVLLKVFSVILILCNQYNYNYKLINNCNVYVLWAAYGVVCMKCKSFSLCSDLWML